MNKFKFIVLGFLIMVALFFVAGNNSKISVQKTQSASIFDAIWSSFVNVVSGNSEKQLNDINKPELDCSLSGYAYISKWGSPGTANGEFSGPVGVAVGLFGNVYVTDSLNNRIQRFNPGGQYYGQWGNSGKSNGQFNRPAGIAIDTNGYVYVVDKGNLRIQKFSQDGIFITKWGPVFTENVQFGKELNGIATDSLNNVYVVDSSNNRILKFNSNGVFITKFGSVGNTNGKFKYPYDIAIDAQDVLYITDSLNNRVQKFSANGNYLGQWGSSGIGDGQFNSPLGIHVNKAGEVFVVDSGNSRIQVFSQDGGYIEKWGTTGSLDGEFKGARDVTVGNEYGVVYVADSGNNRIQMFNKGCGQIIVTKYVVPNPDPTDFTFNTNFAGAFLLDDDTDSVLSDTKMFTLPPSNDTYEVKEESNQNYETFLTCADLTGDTTTSGAMASIKLSPGETVICNFRNTCIAPLGCQ